MSNTDTRLDVFIKKAQELSSNILEASSLQEALSLGIDICKQKAPCQLVMSENNRTFLQESNEKIIAGVDLPDECTGMLQTLAQQNNITFIVDNLRKYLKGFDVAISIADFGIAETGTVVCKSTKEDFRIATMVCEQHVVIMPKSKIVDTAFSIQRELTEWMSDSACYTAFISGPSRTADIERVLAIGVHGPLAMHIILLED